MGLKVRSVGEQSGGSPTPAAATGGASGPTRPRAKVVEVAGYSGSGRREPLEIVVHGPAGVGKTMLAAATLPAPSAWVISEPGATAPILSQLGLNRLPRIIARNFDEFMAGGTAVGHKGFAAFAAALPPSIEWIVIDTFSTLLTSQHAAHLAEAQATQAEKAALAAKRGREPPGVDKFWVLDSDLNRARLMQAALQSSGRNLLFLAHTAPLSGNDAQDSQSTTAGRPVIPGQFRTYMEAWASAILHLATDHVFQRDDAGKVHKIQVPKLNLNKAQQPLVKHKWALFGSMEPDLGKLLTDVKEWPR